MPKYSTYYVDSWLINGKHLATENDIMFNPEITVEKTIARLSVDEGKGSSEAEPLFGEFHKLRIDSIGGPLDVEFMFQMRINPKKDDDEKFLLNSNDIIVSGFKNVKSLDVLKDEIRANLKDKNSFCSSTWRVEKTAISTWPTTSSSTTIKHYSKWKPYTIKYKFETFFIGDYFDSSKIQCDEYSVFVETDRFRAEIDIHREERPCDMSEADNGVVGKQKIHYFVRLFNNLTSKEKKYYKYNEVDIYKTEFKNKWEKLIDEIKNEELEKMSL